MNTHTHKHTHTHTHTHTYYILTGEWDLKTFLKESYAIMHSLEFDSLLDLTNTE